MKVTMGGVVLMVSDFSNDGGTGSGNRSGSVVVVMVMVMVT